jgi:HEAT repeat protein
VSDSIDSSHPDPQIIPSREDCLRILASLPSLPLEERADVVERLVRNPSPEIRDRALQIGAAVFSDRHLTELLREDGDAALRNAGSEIFLLRGSRSLPAVLPLLHDPDPDVVLQAVLILDRLRDPRALEPLYGALAHADPNIRQEVILAIGRLGDGRSVPRLLPFLDGDVWLQMAAVQALGDLRAAEGIAPLALLLRDALVGSLAAESLARIGGPAAFTVLADCWENGMEADDHEMMAGLLAHVLEGLAAPPQAGPALRERLLGHLRGGLEGLRSAAARCLLCLGPGPWDAEALAVLAASQPASDFAPEALRHRPDLLGPLLRGGETERSWGFLLAARYPDQVPAQDFLAAVTAITAVDSTPGQMGGELVAALGQVHVPGIAPVVLDLYLRLSPEERPAFEPVLEAHAALLRDAVATRTDLDDIARLELASLLGEPAEALTTRLLALAPPLRRRAAAALVHQEALMRRLPWEEWLRAEPELFTDLAAHVAGRYGLTGLGSALRARLAAAPSPALVRALGELGDSAGMPDLLRLCEERPDLLSIVLEALGRLGGTAARGMLRKVASAGGPDTRIAYKALAACHEAADVPLFRHAAAHPDWLIRLAAAEVLGLSAAPEDTALLARLAADPVSLVAQRALALLQAGRGETH